MPDDRYVDRAAWLDPRGRTDAIDEVADQFERRREVTDGAEQFWTSGATAWPQRTRGPRTTSFLRHAEGARLAG